MFDPIAAFLGLLANPITIGSTDINVGSSFGLPGVTIGLGS